MVSTSALMAERAAAAAGAQPLGQGHWKSLTLAWLSRAASGAKSRKKRRGRRRRRSSPHEGPRRRKGQVENGALLELRHLGGSTSQLPERRPDPAASASEQYVLHTQQKTFSSATDHLTTECGAQDRARVPGVSPLTSEDGPRAEGAVFGQVLSTLPQDAIPVSRPYGPKGQVPRRGPGRSNRRIVQASRRRVHTRRRVARGGACLRIPGVSRIPELYKKKEIQVCSVPRLGGTPARRMPVKVQDRVRESAAPWLADVTRTPSPIRRRSFQGQPKNFVYGRIRRSFRRGVLCAKRVATREEGNCV